MTKNEETNKKLINHVKYAIRGLNEDMERKRRDQKDLAAVIGRSVNGMSPWGKVYHESVIELESLQDRVSVLAPVLEMLTGESPADIIKTNQQGGTEQ